eukprot:m.82185 g.82185  ORF g.82185 m.82185 type:complete len:212 (+) comp12677_c0_seq2:112-747(+)
MAQFRTMEQIQSEANATLDEDLQRTERMKRLVQDDRETNAKTLEELDRQGDALRRIEGHVDGIHASNVEARGHISHMEKWCGLFRCKKYVQPDYIFVHSKTHCCSSLFDVSNCVLVYLTTTSKRTNPLTWIHIHTSNKATFAVSGLFLTRSRPILGCPNKYTKIYIVGGAASMFIIVYFVHLFSYFVQEHLNSLPPPNAHIHTHKNSVAHS